MEQRHYLKDDIHFITRLPENFGVCGELISTAVATTASWEDVGQLSQRVVNGKNTCARYRILARIEPIPIRPPGFMLEL